MQRRSRDEARTPSGSEARFWRRCGYDLGGLRSDHQTPVIKLQLKLLERLSKREVISVISRAEELGKGRVRPLFPESADPELATFYVIEAVDTQAAERVIQGLKEMKEVELVSRPAKRTHK